MSTFPLLVLMLGCVSATATAWPSNLERDNAFTCDAFYGSLRHVTGDTEMPSICPPDQQIVVWAVNQVHLYMSEMYFSRRVCAPPHSNIDYDQLQLMNEQYGRMIFRANRTAYSAAVDGLRLHDGVGHADTGHMLDRGLACAAYRALNGRLKEVAQATTGEDVVECPPSVSDFARSLSYIYTLRIRQAVYAAQCIIRFPHAHITQPTF